MLAAAYDAQRRALCRTVANRYGAADGEDVVQDVFVKLLADPGRYVQARGAFEPYLRMVTRGRAVDVARTERAHRDRHETAYRRNASSGVTPPEEAAVRNVMAERLKRHLRALPAREREVIRLAFFEQRPYREVAAVLGIPEGTTKARIRSGLRRLRLALQCDGFASADFR